MKPDNSVNFFDVQDAMRRILSVVESARVTCNGDVQKMFSSLIGAVGHMAAAMKPDEGDLFYRVAIETLTVARAEFAKYNRGEQPFAFLNVSSREGAN